MSDNERSTVEGFGVEVGADPRDVDARGRDDLAVRRDLSSDQRDSASRQRDTLGDRRDLVLEFLDDEADRADRAAIERDRVAENRADGSGPGETDQEQAEQAAADRVDSRHDRERAERDRRAGAAQRAQAGLDRMSARVDRIAARDDRSRAGLDRTTAMNDRAIAAVEREQATIDDLTGAYRRGPGLVELDREIARAARSHEPLVVAFLDVDGLKAVNDSLGHEAGDCLLTDVVRAVEGCMRPYDVVVRYGGDEFLCICQGITEADARSRLATVNDTLAPDGRSISVGLAQLELPEAAASLIARADHALYENRNSRGRHEPDDRGVRSHHPRPA